MSEIGLDLTQFIDRRVLRELTIQAHYEGYMRQEQLAIENLRALEAWRIPADFDYAALPGLRNESRMKLQKIRPGTLAQAARISAAPSSRLARLQAM